MAIKTAHRAQHLSQVRGALPVTCPTVTENVLNSARLSHQNGGRSLNELTRQRACEENALLYELCTLCCITRCKTDARGRFVVPRHGEGCMAWPVEVDMHKASYEGGDGHKCPELHVACCACGAACGLGID